MIFIFSSFALGIIVLFHYPCLLAVFLASIVFLLNYYRKFYSQISFKKFQILIVIIFFLLGAIWVFPYKLGFLRQRNNYKNTIQIIVLTAPQNKGKYNYFRARLEKINGFPNGSYLNVYDYSNFHKKIGERFLIEGKVRKANNNFYLLVIYKKTPILKMKTYFWEDLLWKTNQKLLYILKKHLASWSWPVYASILLGRREFLPKNFIKTVKHAGVIHLLALSGLHLGLLSWGIIIFLSALNINYRIKLLLTLIFIFIYLAIAGVRPSLYRASLMFLFPVFAFFLKRRISIWDNFSLAGLVSLLIYPLWIFDVSFQLSFFSVLAIIIFSNINIIRFNSRFKLFKFTFTTVLISISVLLITLPLTAYYFNKVYLVSIFSNIICIPLFILIMLNGLFLIILSPLTIIADFAAVSCNFFLFLFYKAVEFFARNQYLVLKISMDIKTIIIYYILLASIIIFLYRGNKLIHSIE